MSGRRVVCVDVGSTFTKACLVDVDAGRLLGRAEHLTTTGTDVLDGVDACLRVLDAPSGVEVLACSSAGGGLRIAVVGNEELVTAEAGRRVALSSGGTVVAVVAAAEGPVTLPALGGPDVVLLTGGTDGGDVDVVTRAAHQLAGAGWRGPVVMAGNVDAREHVSHALDGLPVVLADNVVPQIGRLRPEGARVAIREMFLRHVIGGKHLSSRDDGLAFPRLVHGATPDVVLTGVQVLAGIGGDVAVVDVGGATTDVHSVVRVDPERRDASPASAGAEAPLSREVVAPSDVTRTVEGDLGLRWSAPTTVAAAGLAELEDAAAERLADPALVPTDDAGHDTDEAIARAALGLALRRHAGRARVVVSPEGRVVERTGTDLRETDLLVLSGGVLRHGRPGVAARLAAGSIGSDAGGRDDGWQLPQRARVVVDADYLLAPIGLLAAEHPRAAARLAECLLAAADAT